MTTSRVALIGLDGATFDVIDPLVAQGRLPHIASLIARGTRASLISTIPIASWPAWPTMMTGVEPGKHGVYHHYRRDGYREQVVSARDVRAETLWEALSRQGRRVAVIGVPVTYPPRAVNGVLVCGVPMPPGLHAYPAELGEELRRAVPGYPVASSGADWGRVFRLRGGRGLLGHFERSLDLSLGAALHLWQRERWDAFICVFCELDRVQHLVPWPRDPDAPGAAQRRTLIARCYEKADQALGRLLQALGDGVTVALVSDHGFGENRKTFYLNRLLAQRGLLAVRTGRRRRPEVVRRTVDEALGAIGFEVGGLIGALPLWLPRLRGLRLGEAIDWSRTSAFAASADLDGVYVNLRGREPQGVVAPGGQYEQVRQMLLTMLREVRDPQTGEAIMVWARRREEVFHGPHVEEAPDVMYLTRDNSYPQSGRLDGGDIIGSDARGRAGGHRLEGVFVVAGPAARRGGALERCRITDVAPTLLHVLGLAINDNVDGAVLHDALNQDYLGHRPVAFCSPPAAPEATPWGYSPQEQEQLERQLRGLGYI